MIRFVFRWAFRLLLLVIVLTIGLVLLKDTIARAVAEQQLRRQTGFETRVGKADFGLLVPKVTLEDVVIYNPPEFGGSKLMDAAEVHLEYDPKQLAWRRVHLTFLRVRLRELSIVESNGRTNLLELLQNVEVPGRSGPARATAKRYEFTGVDLLNLSVGQVRYDNLQRPKRSQQIRVNSENQLIRDVRSEQDLINIMLKLLFRAGITIYAH